MKSKSVFYQYLQYVFLMTIIATVSIGFVFPLSVFQGFILIPVLLLAQMGVWGYAQNKLDSVEVSAKIHCMREEKAKRALNTHDCSEKAA